MTGEPLMLLSVLGHAGDRDWHDRLHAMEHLGQVEVLAIPEAEAARKRMRVRSDRGRDCAIALSRDQSLSDGAVLYCDDRLAIVARVDGAARLRLTPASVDDALRLGHWCGNLHWKVVFLPGAMQVVLEGPVQRYLDRLRDLHGLADFTVEAPHDP
ncbi:urease accessory protein UreE [Paracoccus lichenicola]|uniref:urease accessory protein UreE n=1 Tax=Paracoccus lichenicola TaxID=2665644 RepID=UPI002E233C73